MATPNGFGAAEVVAYAPRVPHRDRYLFVCINRRPDDHPKGSCAERGSEALVPKLKEELSRLGAAKDIVRACSSSCLDLCEYGASMVQEPDHVVYGRVTLADIPEIDEAATRGHVVERLVIARPAAAAATTDTRKAAE